jgi:hypothetical protein
VTVTVSVIEVAPLAVPVASPLMVNVMFWFPDMQVTLKFTVPVEFAAVTQPWPVNEVTPVFVIVVVELPPAVATVDVIPAPLVVTEYVRVPVAPFNDVTPTF